MARSAKSRRTRHRGHAETSKKATEIDENPLKSEALDSAVLMHRRKDLFFFIFFTRRRTGRERMMNALKEDKLETVDGVETAPF